jgi:hypothetical protein
MRALLVQPGLRGFTVVAIAWTVIWITLPMNAFFGRSVHRA